MRRVVAKEEGRRVCAAPGGLIPKKKVGWGDRRWGEMRCGMDRVESACLRKVVRKGGRQSLRERDSPPPPKVR